MEKTDQQVRDEIAQQIFINVLSQASDLGNTSIEEQTKLFDVGAEICLRAASRFVMMKHNRPLSYFGD